MGERALVPQGARDSVQSKSAGHEGDNLADIDRQADVLAGGQRSHDGSQFAGLQRNPVRAGVAAAGQLAVDLAEVGAVADGNHISGPDLNGGPVDRLAVELEMPVRDPLAGLGPGEAEAGAADDVVEPALTDDEQVVA